MKDLISWIEDRTGNKVDRDKLYKFLYARKIQASRLYFILETCSRLVRDNYLDQFNEDNIWQMENNKIMRSDE